MKKRRARINVDHNIIICSYNFERMCIFSMWLNIFDLYNIQGEVVENVHNVL